MLSPSMWFSAWQVAGSAVVRAAGTGETFKNIMAGAASIATALAITIGGFWAYFKFVRGRTFRPQLSIKMAGQWRVVLGVGNLFHVRVRVTNIGASKVDLVQHGSGLRISFPAHDQPEPTLPVEWEPVPLRSGDEQFRVFELLEEHQWIEPGETVSDDLLLNLDSTPRIAKLELWLGTKLRGWGWRKDVDVFARQIIPPDSAMIDTG